MICFFQKLEISAGLILNTWSFIWNNKITKCFAQEPEEAMGLKKYLMSGPCESFVNFHSFRNSGKFCSRVQSWKWSHVNADLKWSNSIPDFRPKWFENHIHFADIHTYLTDDNIEIIYPLYPAPPLFPLIPLPPPTPQCLPYGQQRQLLYYSQLSCERTPSGIETSVR